VLYWGHENGFGTPLLLFRGSTLKLTFWVLGLLALAAAVHFVRTRLSRHGDRRAHAKSAADKQRSRADADRRDIQDLVSRLHANSPDPEPETGSGAAGSGTPRLARPRLSSEAAQGHDPDLPPPRQRAAR
jgi:hypothetical protein